MILKNNRIKILLEKLLQFRIFVVSKYIYDAFISTLKLYSTTTVYFNDKIRIKMRLFHSKYAMLSIYRALQKNL